jgi:hypothetical protein
VFLPSPLGVNFSPGGGVNLTPAGHISSPWARLKVYLHEQWFLCGSVLRNTKQQAVRISSNPVTLCRVARRDTKNPVRVNRPLISPMGVKYDPLESS